MRRLRRYAMPLGRLTAFVVACAVATSFFGYRTARASIIERLLDLSRKMRPYLDEDGQREKPRELRINGVTLYVAAGHSNDPPAAVRAWYASVYRADGVFDRLAKEARRRGKELDAGALNQLQFGDDDEGGLVALDFPHGTTPLLLAKHLVAFLADGELGPVAAVRYVYVKRAPSGGTQYLTMWTDDRFSLFDLVPDGRHDAPGQDLDDVPRPPRSVRLLTVAERGMPQRLAIYSTSAMTTESAELFYRARLRTLGWQPEDEEGGSGGRRKALRFSRDGRQLLVSVSASRDGQRVLVSLLLHG